jgi:molybdenum cofactor cytidylyltransferase
MERKAQSSGVAAVILAAGMSRRMKAANGALKQLMSVAGKPLLQHTLDNVRRSQVDEKVLVLGHAAESVRQQVSTDGLRVLVNENFQEGMGTSLRAGIGALGPSVKAAFAVLADQPFVRPETLDWMIGYHRQSGAQITIPLYRGFRGNPVLLDRSVFAEVMALSGDVGCRAIFGSHTEGIHKLEVDDPGILLDIDSTEDFEKLSRPGLAAEIAALPELECRPDVGKSAPELVIVGRDAVAMALAKLARVLRFTVTLVDPLLPLRELPDVDRVLHVLDFSKLPAGERVVVVASRGQCDEEAVDQALKSDAAYVALLANKKRAQDVMNSLRIQGMSDEKIKSVRAPAGVSINAETPEEIALSILAEIIAVRRGAANKFGGGPEQQ